MELKNEIPNKIMDKSSINRLLKKFRDTGAVNRLIGSSRPRSARTEENVDLVNDLVVSQEDTLQTYRMLREILIISLDVMKLPP